ncbi:HAMP domain-containing sensor histidine kinase [Geomonas edaphica]|uniref:HAMP domain-containing sensor histidine kinase n=1 Tax=Geomonas edaphica TaxID=2570226 RepID=UPI0013A5C877|nr:HAMP domain-containing sensor histidine kinase [Geomonas edaphica]
MRRLLILHWISAVVMAMALVFLLFVLVVKYGNAAPWIFGAGLGLIGAFFSLMAVPSSVHITKPLERLEESALRLAAGNLSARAELLGERHMVGKDLVNAFNIMAEKVESMVRGGKELMANVSHEMRSPLARIRIAGECLKDALDRGDSGDARNMLQTMWEDIEEADKMIGRILEFSKVDLLEPLPMADEVRLAEILDDLARTLKPFARSKQIAMTLALDSSVLVAGDREWLRSAFKNLLENALRYTDPGGAIAVTSRKNGGVIIEFTNTFAPLDAAELHSIFEPFYRGATSHSDGTGLGLAIVKKIIGLHHGEVGAKNVPEGFQVWVRLPVI